MFVEILASLVAIVLSYVIYFYVNLRHYPPGPLPLPLLGNVLSFANSKRHLALRLIEMSKKRPYFTLWIGYEPFIVINDLEIGKKYFSLDDFSGRPHTLIGDEFNKNCADVTFMDFGPEWQTLRKVGKSAVRKLVLSPKYSKVACTVVEESFAKMIETNIPGKPFSPSFYLHYIQTSIMSELLLGKRYPFETEQYKLIHYALSGWQKDFGNKLVVFEFIPWARFLYQDKIQKQREALKFLRELILNSYREHLKLGSRQIDDFCDALISAKSEALTEGKESAKYLTDENLSATTFDLLFVGIDTTYSQMQWMIMFLAKHPEKQYNLREEIQNILGDRIPTIDDRMQCHYTNAVIHEVLRLRNATPLGLLHQTVKEVQFENYTLKKNTKLIVNQYNIMLDEKHWKDPYCFEPERFLDKEGQFVRPHAMVPFSIGKRVCLGDVIALNNLFLFIVRFIQLSKDFFIEPGPVFNLESDLTLIELNQPKEFEIIMNKIKN